MCTPDHAVKVAHMMSCATAVFDATGDTMEPAELLREYLDGSADEDRAIKTFFEGWPEAFPGRKALGGSNE